MLSVGIDTSCYTTSVAVMDEQYRLLYEKRIMLEVAPGSRGLRQSDAVFQHMKHLSLLVADCFERIDPAMVQCISASSKPRTEPDSYMPVFTAGVHTAKVMTSCLKKPLFEVSHQQNHILAGIWSSKHCFSRAFAAYHISGGTTELLHVTPLGGAAMDIRLIGGSSDLKAGQFIDRVGVAMGFGFPCGQAMDKLCDELEKDGAPVKGIDIPFHTDKSFASFSGPESHVQRLIAAGKPGPLQQAEIAAGVFGCIAKAIEATACRAKAENSFGELLLIGGVASNKRIKEFLTRSEKLLRQGIRPIFSEAAYASDNAVGTAFYGMSRLCGPGGTEKPGP